MHKAHRDHDEATAEMFRDDPAFAAEYLTDVLNDGNEVDIMLALRSLSHAFGTVPPPSLPVTTTPDEVLQLAAEAGNPRLRDFRNLLNQMGFQLTILPLETTEERNY